MASGDTFDVGVVDMKMPGVTGAQLATRLRSSPGTMVYPLSCSAVTWIARPRSAATYFRQFLPNRFMPTDSKPVSVRPRAARAECGSRPNSVGRPDRPPQWSSAYWWPKTIPSTDSCAGGLLEKLGHVVDMADERAGCGRSRPSRLVRRCADGHPNAERWTVLKPPNAFDSTCPPTDSRTLWR